jgi:Cdc6-like AAA superfamily ATPase
MTRENTFPRSLLKKPKEECLAYFNDLTIAHPRLVEAFDELIKVIRRGCPGTLVSLYGPSGVGKSTLLRKIQKQLTEEILPELEKERWRIPVVVDELIGPDSGIFNWKDFYRRLLVSMDEILVDRKIVYETIESRPNRRIYFKTGPRSVTTDLRFAVEQTIKERRPIAMLLDEAQHLAKMASGRKLHDQLDCLKSLSNRTGVLFVLLGTYELLVFRNLNAQLSRRSISVHFRRYLLNDKRDIEAFKAVLLTFQKHLPLRVEPDLIGRWEYFYERSIGCVGVLKDWLTRALGEALDEEADCLSDEHLEMYALSVDQCDKMLTDALDGEKKFVEGIAKRRDLRARLGLITESRARNAAVQKRPATVTARPKSKRSLRRGRRVAKRDPIAA